MLRYTVYFWIALVVEVHCEKCPTSASKEQLNQGQDTSICIVALPQVLKQIYGDYFGPIPEILDRIEGQLENTERAVNSIEPAKNKYLKVLSDKIELQSKIESRQAALAEAVEALHCSLEYKNVASGGQMHPEFRKLGSRFFYIERNVRRDWFGAAQKCREMGGQLALPQDEAEFSLIHQQLGSNGHWLDISDLAEKNKFVSLVTGSAAPFLKWKAGEPNKNPDAHCVLTLAGSFSKYLCSDRHFFVCQALLGGRLV